MRKPVIWITSIAGAAVLIAGGTAVAVAAASSAPAPSPSTTVAGDDSNRSASPSPSASRSSSDLEAAITAALAEVGPGTVIDADTDDNADYAYEIDVLLDGGSVVEVKLDSSLNVVSTQSDDRGDSGSSGDDAVPEADAVERASAAALAHVGSGTVVGVELSDDGDHVYQVEIDLVDGDDVDVELDEDFAVVTAG
jgi:uncharacterized membrane protein YkoI